MADKLKAVSWAEALEGSVARVMKRFAGNGRGPVFREVWRSATDGSERDFPEIAESVKPACVAPKHVKSMVVAVQKELCRALWLSGRASGSPYSPFEIAHQVAQVYPVDYVDVEAWVRGFQRRSDRRSARIVAAGAPTPPPQEVPRPAPSEDRILEKARKIRGFTPPPVRDSPGFHAPETFVAGPTARQVAAQAVREYRAASRRIGLKAGPLLPAPAQAEQGAAAEAAA